MAGTGDYQEEVLSGLLGLQAELRGESPEGGIDAPAASMPDDAVVREGPGAPSTQPTDVEPVTVATSGLQVTVAPSSAAVAERVAALNARLSRLEETLADVTGRLDGSDQAEQRPDPADDPDASWRSFLDLQRIVADRLDRR